MSSVSAVFLITTSVQTVNTVNKRSLSDGLYSSAEKLDNYSVQTFILRLNVLLGLW